MRSKKALYNIGTNLLLQMIIVIYGFIVPKIIISSFGSDVNGLISSITQFLAYIALLESGFGPVVKSALYKPIAKKDNDVIANILRTTEKFFRAIGIIFLFYIVMLCFLYPFLVSKNFSWLYTTSLIIIIGISTFAEYFFGMTYRLFLQAEQKTYIISIIQIVTYILSTIVIIILAKLNASIQLIKLASGLIFVIRPFLQNIYVKKKYKINYENVNSNYKLKQKWAGLAQHIAAVIHGNTDVTVLTIFSTLKEVSVYSVYYLVIKGIKSIIQAFNSGIDASFGDMLAKKEYDNLNKKYKIYELFFHTISTIIFVCAMILITPFISVYTKEITDVNYIRNTFGILIVISEFIWSIRLPYSSIISAAGHFKETQIGAWIEASINIIVSSILVFHYGIIGVAIGTIIAMSIRTIEFMIHTSNKILYRNIFDSLRWLIIISVETNIVLLICNFVPSFISVTSYLTWMLYAIEVLLITSLVVLPINLLTNLSQVKGLKEMILTIINRKKVK